MMSPGAAPGAEPLATQRQVGIVDQDQNAVRGNLVEGGHPGHGLAAGVHERLGPTEDHPATRDSTFSNLGKELGLHPPRSPPALGQPVRQHEAGIVTCVPVFGTRIPQSHDER